MIQEAFHSLIDKAKAQIDQFKQDVEMLRTDSTYGPKIEKCQEVFTNLTSQMRSTSESLMKKQRRSETASDAPTERMAIYTPVVEADAPATSNTLASKVRRLPSLKLGAADNLTGVFNVALIVTLVTMTAIAARIMYQQNDWIGVTASLAVGLGALFGYYRGVVPVIVSLIGIVVAFFAAPQLGVENEHLLTEQFGTAGILNRGLAILAATALVYLGFVILSTLVLALLTRPSYGMSPFHRLCGVVGGGFHAAVLTLAIVSWIGILEPMLPQPSTTAERSATADWAARLGTAMQQSQLLATVDRYDPLAQLPMLRDVKSMSETIPKLDSPLKVRSLMRHAKIMELRQDPKMKQAVQRLAEEPELVTMLTTSESVSVAEVLLRSPAVLNLFEQPGFLPAVVEVMSDQQDFEAGSTTTRYTSVEE